MSVHENPEQYTGYTFQDHGVIEKAVKQNKRLGFLGDKVVGLIILDTWYRTNKNCESGNHELQLYGSNREMANEARIARFDEFVEHDFMHSQHWKPYTHDLATEVEAIIGAVWIDSGRE
ncbi:hypothetical protein BJX99DRAFT_252234 [Aspergillus californicus]